MHSDYEPIQQINVGMNRNIEFASMAALAVQVCEFANSFFDEAEYLCRSRFTPIKGLYIWSRYIPLIVQIVDLILTYKMSKLPMENQLCVGTFVFRATIGQQTLTCVEIILLIRIYALYNQSRRVKYILCTAFVTNGAVEMWGSSQIIRALLQAKCCNAEITPFAPRALITFGASASFLQVSILCMTLFYYAIGHHYRRARSPLISLILREGIVAFFLIFGIVGVNVAYEHIRMEEVRKAAFAWYVCLLSVAGCRLILDMRKLAVSHPTCSSDEIELTSNLDMTRPSSESLPVNI